MNSTYSNGAAGYNLATTGDALPPLPQAGSPTAAAPGQSLEDIMNFAREMARRNAMAQLSAVANARAQAIADRRGAASETYAPERLVQPNRVETPWYSAQGAATRPVGLGPAMIPGMMADPRLLPPSMRPDQAAVNYSPGTIDRSRRAAEDDAAFNDQLDADRARSRTQIDPYEAIRRQNLNAGYGR